LPDLEGGKDAWLIEQARERASSLRFAYRRRWNLSAADPALLDLTETDMLVDLYADRLADEREMLRRNPGLSDVWKIATNKQAQAEMTSNAQAWLSDPATLARLRAIGAAPAEPAPPKAPRLSLGRAHG
jgi:hypothetical protein